MIISKIKRTVLHALLLAGATGSAKAVDDYTMELYETYCKGCHSIAGANIPVAFNNEDWQSKMKDGLEPLVTAAINGKGNMPPQGLCQECTYEDFEDLINYMATPSAEHTEHPQD